MSCETRRMIRSGKLIIETVRHKKLMRMYLHIGSNCLCHRNVYELNYFWKKKRGWKIMNEGIMRENVYLLLLFRANVLQKSTRSTFRHMNRKALLPEGEQWDEISIKPILWKRFNFFQRIPVRFVPLMWNHFRANWCGHRCIAIRTNCSCIIRRFMSFFLKNFKRRWVLVSVNLIG